MPKISRTVLKSKFATTRSPKKALKVSVAAAMIVALGLTSLILITGLFVPQSLLVKLSKNGSSNTSGADASSSIAGQTPEVVNTVKQADGTIVATNSDGSTTITAPNGTTTTTPPTSGTSTGTSGGTTPTTGGGTTPPTSGGGSTPPSGGGTTPAAGVAPSLTFSGSPTSITTGASSTLSWSINGTATAPVTCTAGGSWSGAKATSGSQAVTPASTASYTLVCTNSAGSSGTKTVSITVSAPPSTCNAGGTCKLSDVQQHATASNCWVAVTGAGYNKVYIFTSSFNTSHISTAGKASNSSTKTCGKAIAYTTLRGYNGDHSNGTKIGGNTFDTWLASFYYANYQ